MQTYPEFLKFSFIFNCSRGPVSHVQLTQDRYIHLLAAQHNENLSKGQWKNFKNLKNENIGGMGSNEIIRGSRGA